MIVNFMSTYFFPHFLHKVQPLRFTGSLFEVEGIISCLYVGGQGVGEVGDIFWRRLGSLFIVEQLVCKNSCLWKYGLGGRHGHIRKDGNDAKYLWYVI